MHNVPFNNIKFIFPGDSLKQDSNDQYDIQKDDSMII